MSAFEEELAVAEEAARAAGTVMAEHRADGVTTATKSARTDIVTAADTACQERDIVSTIDELDGDGYDSNMVEPVAKSWRGLSTVFQQEKDWLDRFQEEHPHTFQTLLTHKPHSLYRDVTVSCLGDFITLGGTFDRETGIYGIMEDVQYEGEAALRDAAVVEDVTSAQRAFIRYLAEVDEGVRDAAPQQPYAVEQIQEELRRTAGEAEELTMTASRGADATTYQ